ncbi:hypothetical protein BJV74DRAFT_119404 [Russula compacta]|nr:hypothetical protein BJV74DRAFT_119404 [Russula compacta]
MESQLRTHSPLETTLSSFPASTKAGFIPRGLGKAYRRIGAKLRNARSMDMSRELSVVSLNSHPQACALGSHHVRPSPRPDSPVSAHSGSSPGSSQGKASMEAEQRNARPFPSGFTQPGSHDLLLTTASRTGERLPSPSPYHHIYPWLDLYRLVFRTAPIRMRP